MKPNEIRIGNCVRIKGNDTIVKVERISRRKVGFFYNGDKSRGYFRKYSEIDGILIYDHWQKIDCRSLMHSGYDDEIGKYNYYHSFYPKRVFRFIHELQNIHHALTGEELKIEL